MAGGRAHRRGTARPRRRVAQCKPAALLWNEGSIDFTLPCTYTEAEMQSECVVGEW